MNTPDLVTILGNISQSLYPVQRLIAGMAYLMGLIFFFIAFEKLKKIAGSGHSSQEKVLSPLLYLVFGAVLIYLPTALQVAANSAFGVGVVNVLSYGAQANSGSLYSSMGLLIHTAGLIWFFRGCMLVVHSADAGEHHGVKGLLFLCAGIISMNFEYTLTALNTGVTSLINATMTFKSSQGF
jgi:hypothetical protein